MIIDPLLNMKLRTKQLESSLGASYGHVREWSKNLKTYAKIHQGWDLEAPVGTSCIAIADGFIEYVDSDPVYGKQIILRFSRSGNRLQSIPGDTLFAHYAHLLTILVTVGQEVRSGGIIGQTGTTGNASAKAPHLHFEIRSVPKPGKGLKGHIDPAEILGFHHLKCGP